MHSFIQTHINRGSCADSDIELASFCCVGRLDPDTVFFLNCVQTMGSWDKHTTVPSSYVFPHECRPQLQHDDYSSPSATAVTAIPTVDLAYQSADPSAKQHALSQLRRACLEWGIFHVVNHGVSPQLLERVRSQALSFFSLPRDVKNRVAKLPGEFTGFGHATVHEGDAQPWAEGFYLSDVGKVEDTARKLWPQKHNPEFAASYQAFDEAMKKLCTQLAGMVVETLGVTDLAHFHKYYLNDAASGLFRWNFYPACPEPEKTLGMKMHTDFTLFTVLDLGDRVGGLQVRNKAGDWIAVKPSPGAFAINIGDMMQVLTNGLYPSVCHRAVVNKTEARLSLAYLFLPSSEIEVVAAPELLARDGAEPLYRPFKLHYYTEMKQMHFSNTLDHFTRL